MHSTPDIDVRQYDMSKNNWADRDFDPVRTVERTRKKDKIRVGLLVPFSGLDAMWGPPGQYSGVLAAALVNATGGILGKEIELFGTNSGGHPHDVVNRVGELINVHDVDVLVGSHMSNVRVAVRDAFSQQVPYIYATQYEGGESAKGLFAIGETPENQYRDAIVWMVQNMGAKRWYLHGNDYVWPRKTHLVLHQLIHEAGGEVVGIDYVPIGTEDHQKSLHKIRKAAPDIVFECLVGSDCVTFNQDFGQAGMAQKIARISGVIEENVLMGIGEENAQNLYAVSGYFNSLETPENRSFLHEYKAAFGEAAPIQGGMSETCYESIFFLAALARQAGSLRVDDLMTSAQDFTYSGARGRVRISNKGTDMDCHLMRSNGLEYELIKSFRHSA
jgi:ABC-type branched-subunit amino acid transport system substrate-binding protein